MVTVSRLPRAAHCTRLVMYAWVLFVSADFIIRTARSLPLPLLVPLSPSATSHLAETRDAPSQRPEKLSASAGGSRDLLQTSCNAVWPDTLPFHGGGYAAPPTHWRSRPWTTGTHLDGGELYPITHEMLARSYTPPAASCSWPRVIAALNAGKLVRFSVIGGSMTVGSDCGGKEHCAWPRYLPEWFHRVEPHWRVVVSNDAHGGIDSKHWASAHIVNADVYIIDTGINDFQSDGAGLGALIARLRLTKASNVTGAGCPPALLYVQPFMTCGDRLADCEQRCTQPGSIKLWNATPIFDGLPYWYCDTELWSGGDANAAVARAAGLPVASYRDAMWPVAHSPPPDFPMYWNGINCNHPDAVTHELFSDVVRYALGRLLLPEACSGARGSDGRGGSGSTAAAPPVPSLPPLCALRPATLKRMDKDFPAEFREINTRGSWVFGEDRPGKAGWIGRLPAFNASAFREAWELPTAEISFPVSFPAAFSGQPALFEPTTASTSSFPSLPLPPRLEIEFSRSYESFLDARVHLSCCKRDRRIDDLAHLSPALRGWWKHHYTMPDTVSWQAPGAGVAWVTDGHGGFSERVFDVSCDCRAGMEHTVTIEVVPPPLLQPLPELGEKGQVIDWHVKLLSVTTC